jgi:serine O-acetyltransferase
VFNSIREDLRRARIANQGSDQGLAALIRECFNPGTQALLSHRFGAWSRTVRIPVLRQLLAALHFLTDYLFGWRVGIFIPVRAQIGPGFVIHTWCGGIVLPACPIGKNVTIIGGGIQFDYETQSIGEDCSFAPGTKFVGKIRIGNRVRTAPNSVVQCDVPDDSLAFGNPARIVPIRRWSFASTGGATPRADAATATPSPEPTPTQTS